MTEITALSLSYPCLPHIMCLIRILWTRTHKKKAVLKQSEKSIQKISEKSPARFSKNDFTLLQNLIMFYPRLSQHLRNGKIHAVTRCLAMVKNASPSNTCSLHVVKTSHIRKPKIKDNWQLTQGKDWAVRIQLC